MTVAQQGYYRKPTLARNMIVFVCEGDLWSVPVNGGLARRLTVSQLECNRPCLSPDAQTIAFTARDDGAPEVYRMSALGGVPERLTYQDTPCQVCGWSRDGQSILYTSMVNQPFNRYARVWKIDARGGIPELLPYGPVNHLSFSETGGLVLSRSEQEYSVWKRYRGGRRGEFWLDREGTGSYQRILADFGGNLGNPLWIKDRIFFLSDRDGHGNLYSCDLDGLDVQRHTSHMDYYPRAASTDGESIIYQCGGEIMLYDPASQTEKKIGIEINSCKPQLRRKFVEAADFMEGYALHPQGHSVLVTTRGKLFAMGNWEREVHQIAERDGVRYRLSGWLPDGKRIITVSDLGGEEAIEIHHVPRGESVNSPNVVRLSNLDTGRILALACSPTGPMIGLANQRNEVFVLNLDTRALTLVDRSEEEPVEQPVFSPCGQWLAYYADRKGLPQIFLYHLPTGQVTMVTDGLGRNKSPNFDPGGNYLYFISYRVFNPVYDTVRFDIGFPMGAKPYLVTLQKRVESPFHPEPLPLDGKQAGPSGNTPELKEEDKTPKPLVIDTEGIQERIIPFPVKEGRYNQIFSVGGKVFYSDFPVRGSINDAPPVPCGVIKTFSYESQKEEVFAEGLDTFELDLTGKTLAYRAKNRLRVVRTNQKPEDKDQQPGRVSGWIDLSRIKVSIVPRCEWQQMFRDLWRLQRDHFWTRTMSSVDWDEVYERYRPLLERIATRQEFSDLAWEVHGELGVSHTYEFGGDVPSGPKYKIGKLGADLVLKDGHWTIHHIVRGYSWDPKQDSPLNAVGLNVKEGDRLRAIDGIPLTADLQPGQLLINKADSEVALIIAPQDSDETRQITVKLLESDRDARYREWVLANRKWVQEQSHGRVGYIHIPDMGPEGYSFFSNDYVRESLYEGLIVDARYNAGGHNSQLIIEKLSRRRVGFIVSHHAHATPLPMYSVVGPIVALANEDSGSDGDIFTQTFKMLKLGTIVGKRTWGGVVGISSRDRLVDGALVTQPEFAIWFYDRGFGVENQGVEPDLDIDLSPSDYASNSDRQLERALVTIMDQLRDNPPTQPDFSTRPDRSRPAMLP
ncbi:PDZ domain-containing protein [bacterium]|nr:PDZ domain-containing protein [bacterium]